MVIAVFMAMVAIGALYYLVGLGDALLAQERMQDAADATAFSSAVIHARGMNLLALLNIIMATVLAVLVLIAILASLLNTGAKVLAFAAIFNPALLAGAATLKEMGATVSTVEAGVKPAVNTVLNVGHTLQKPLAKVIPVIAGINAAELSSQSYGPVVSVGTTFPIMSGLPTVDGKFDSLCTKAGEYAGTMASFPIKELFRKIPGGDFIGEKLEKYATAAGRAYADFYCGSGKKPKVPSISVKVSAPELNCSERTTCESDKPGGSCEEYAHLQKKIADLYDVAATECGGTGQDNLYCQQVIRRARTECQTNAGRVISTKWVERYVSHHYKIVGKGFDRTIVADGVTYGEGHTKDHENFGIASPVPCRTAFLPSSNYTAWDVNPDHPVCSEIFPPPTFDDFAGNESYTKTITEISDVLMCVKNKKVKSTLSGNSLGPKDAMRKNTPQEMCNCAALGEDMFQIRSVVFGNAENFTADSDRKVLVATMGREAPSSTLGEIAELVGRLAAAQAEYYFESPIDKTELPREEWLWHIGWKARMRRLSFGRKAWECPEKKNTCERQAGVLGRLSVGQSEKIRQFTEMLKEGGNAIITH